MNIKKFNELYGAEFHLLKQQPMFSAMLSVLEECSPQRQAPFLTPTEATSNAASMLGMIAGYYSAFNIISTQLDLSNIVDEPVATFAPENNKQPE